MRTLENVTYREKLGKRSLSKDLIIVLMYIKRSCEKVIKFFSVFPVQWVHFAEGKNFLTEKAFENRRNFRKAEKSAVPKVFRNSLERSCRCSPAWELEEGMEQGGGSQTITPNQLYFSIISLPISHTLGKVMIFACS